MTQADPARYSRRARVFHWLTFALVLAAYVTINLRKAFERGSDPRILMMESHFLFGIAVLLVVLPRLASRIGERAPPIVPPLSAWMQRAGDATHLLLYAFLIVQPLLGIATLQAEGRAIGLPFTERQIPHLLTLPGHWGHTLEAVHVWLGEAFYWVIGLHILAALFHQLVRKDNTLRRMT